MTSAYWIFLLILLPAGWWAYAYHKRRSVTIWEAVAGTLAAVASIALTFIISDAVVSRSSEILSGHAWRACHTPWWRAEWVEIETSTDGKGNTTVSERVVTEDHPPEWWVDSNLGRLDISEAEYKDLVHQHGESRREGSRPHFDSGDRFDYLVMWQELDEHRPLHPVHKEVWWRDPLVSTGSLLLAGEVSEEEAERWGLPEYPASSGLASRRVVRDSVPQLQWDQLCAILGPSRHVNLILVRLDGGVNQAARLRSYWRNGRKNDLVLCYGDNGGDRWAYVFGWSKRELVKQNLQSILLENDENMVELIGNEVWDNFEPYEWSKAADTPRPIPISVIIVAVLVTALLQAGVGYWFLNNQYEKR